MNKEFAQTLIYIFTTLVAIVQIAKGIRHLISRRGVKPVGVIRLLIGMVLLFIPIALYFRIPLIKW